MSAVGNGFEAARSVLAWSSGGVVKLTIVLLGTIFTIAATVLVALFAVSF